MKNKVKPVCYLFIHDKKDKIKRWFVELTSNPKLAGSWFGYIAVCGTNEKILYANEKGVKRFYPKRKQ
jgi:hypothetical protein